MIINPALRFEKKIPQNVKNIIYVLKWIQNTYRLVLIKTKSKSLSTKSISTYIHFKNSSKLFKSD